MIDACFILIAEVAVESGKFQIVFLAKARLVLVSSINVNCNPHKHWSMVIPFEDPVNSP
jgi:hypothetical protein